MTRKHSIAKSQKFKLNFFGEHVSDVLHFGNTADLHHQFTGIVVIKLRNYFSHTLFRLHVIIL